MPKDAWNGQPLFLLFLFFPFLLLIFYFPFNLVSLFHFILFLLWSYFFSHIIKGATSWMASSSLQIYGNLLVQIKKNHIVTLICSLSLDQHYYKSFSVLPFLHHRVTPIHFNSTWDLLGLNSKCLCENDRDNSKDNLVISSANGSTKIILKCL